MKHIAQLFLLKLLLSLLLASPADAQVVPTAPSGANDSRAASTGFVQQELGTPQVPIVIVSTVTPTLAAGQLGLTGLIANTVLANNSAMMSVSATSGMRLQGNGSANDMAFFNANDLAVFTVPHNTQNITLNGSLSSGGSGPAFSGLLSMLGSTSGQANILVSNSGSHINETSSGAAPTLTAGCNGAGSAVSSNGTGADIHGTITGQTAVATTCTLTFGNAYAAAPDCQATGLNSALTSLVINPGSLVVTFASTANYKWTFRCEGT